MIPVTRPPFAVLITTEITVFHLGIPRAREASVTEFGTAFIDSSAVLATTGIIMIPSAIPPANAEKVPVANTTVAYANMPITIVGNSASTSFEKLERAEILDSGHSEKNIPAATPIGIEINDAIATIIALPCIIGAMPPP